MIEIMLIGGLAVLVALCVGDLIAPSPRPTVMIVTPEANMPIASRKTRCRAAAVASMSGGDRLCLPLFERLFPVGEQLVDSLAGNFVPEDFRDTYREDVLSLIERKAQGKTIAVQPPAEEVAEPAPDLMSALKASLAAVRARESDDDAKGGAKAGKPRKAAAKKAKAGKAEAKAGAKTAAKKAAAKPGSSRAAAKR